MWCEDPGQEPIAKLAGALSEPELRERGRALGRALRGGEVLLLDGPMGAGKTTFTRALAEGLAVDNPRQVRSPTFALCVEHPGPIPLVHIDLFRLEPGGHQAAGYAAFEALGLDFEDDWLYAPDRVLVVEWAERWRSPPVDHLAVRLEHLADDASQRRLSLSRPPPAASRAYAALLRWAESVPDSRTKTE